MLFFDVFIIYLQWRSLKIKKIHLSIKNVASDAVRRGRLNLQLGKRCSRTEKHLRNGHLQVPVDDGRLALVQAGHGLAGVAEDVQDLGLAEAHAQPLVHLLDHLARCGRTGGGVRGGGVRRVARDCRADRLPTPRLHLYSTP